jgi:hypothetical protein
MAEDPAHYAAWYASKPWLLYDWEVRVGHGMEYVVTMRGNLEKPPMVFTTTLQWAMNPLLFCLAFCGIVLGLVRGGTERMVAVALLTLTAVHVVLQAEPRYSIPYRSLEIMLAMGALAYLRGMIPVRQESGNAAVGGVNVPV